MEVLAAVVAVASAPAPAEGVHSMGGAWFLDPQATTAKCVPWMPHHINVEQYSSHAVMAPVHDHTGALAGIPSYGEVKQVNVPGSKWGYELSLDFELYVNGVVERCRGMTFFGMTHFNGTCGAGTLACHYQYRCTAASCNVNVAREEGAHGVTPVSDGLWNTSASSTCLQTPSFSEQFWMHQMAGYGIVRPSNPYQGTNTYRYTRADHGAVMLNTLPGSNTTCDLGQTREGVLAGSCHKSTASGGRTSCDLELQCVGGACLH